MSPALRCGAVALLLVLAGCATQGVRQPPPIAVESNDALQAQAARAQWLATHRDWRVSGRVAISRGGKGGSGRLDWVQAGDTYTVSLSAPITRQSWRLTGSLAGGTARIEGLDGGPREGADAESLLRETTGWDVPVNELSSWITGIAAPGATVDELGFGGDGPIARLGQAGWRIEFTQWNPPQGERPALPARIEAVRGDAKVRLIVDEWTFDAAPPAARVSGAPGARLRGESSAETSIGSIRPGVSTLALDMRERERCGFGCSGRREIGDPRLSAAEQARFYCMHPAAEARLDGSRDAPVTTLRSR